MLLSEEVKRAEQRGDKHGILETLREDEHVYGVETD
jgi:hypothetical protein